jgi:hypothetical protein
MAGEMSDAALRGVRLEGLTGGSGASPGSVEVF